MDYTYIVWSNEKWKQKSMWKMSSANLVVLSFYSVACGHKSDRRAPVEIALCVCRLSRAAVPVLPDKRYLHQWIHILFTVSRIWIYVHQKLWNAENITDLRQKPISVCVLVCISNDSMVLLLFHTCLWNTLCVGLRSNCRINKNPLIVLVTNESTHKSKRKTTNDKQATLDSKQWFIWLDDINSVNFARKCLSLRRMLWLCFLFCFVVHLVRYNLNHFSQNNKHSTAHIPRELLTLLTFLTFFLSMHSVQHTIVYVMEWNVCVFVHNFNYSYKHEHIIYVHFHVRSHIERCAMGNSVASFCFRYFSFAHSFHRFAEYCLSILRCVLKSNIRTNSKMDWRRCWLHLHCVCGRMKEKKNTDK